MGQHQRSLTNAKEVIVFLIIIAILATGAIFAWNVLARDSVSEVNTPRPETSTKAIPMPEIIVPDNSEVQYIKPQVTTSPAPITPEKPPVKVVPAPTPTQTAEPVQPGQSATETVEPSENAEPSVAPEMAYINSVFAKYNYWANPKTRWHFVDTLPEQCNGSACVATLTKTDTGEVVSIDLYMTPGVVRNEYVIIHEAVHTNGIMDECAADAETTRIRGTTEGQGFYTCDR